MSGPAGREGAKIRINKGPWDAFLSLSKLPKRDNLPIRKKRKEKKRESGIMSRATRDFYFNFPVGGENCETCGASFFKGENFFLSFFLEGKSRIRFLSLEFWEKWFIEW